MITQHQSLNSSPSGQSCIITPSKLRVNPKRTSNGLYIPLYNRKPNWIDYASYTMCISTSPIEGINAKLHIIAKKYYLAFNDIKMFVFNFLRKFKADLLNMLISQLQKETRIQNYQIIIIINCSLICSKSPTFYCFYHLQN